MQKNKALNEESLDWKDLQKHQRKKTKKIIKKIRFKGMSKFWFSLSHKYPKV